MARASGFDSDPSVPNCYRVGLGGFTVIPSVPGNQKLGQTYSFFGSPDPDPSEGPIRRFDNEVIMQSRTIQTIGCRWWIISLAGFEVIREDATAATPLGEGLTADIAEPGALTPAQQPDQFRQNLPAAQGGIIRASRWVSNIRGWAQWQDATYRQRQVQFDLAGGRTLYCYAQNVQAGVLLPNNISYYDQVPPNLQPLQDRAVDATVSCRIHPVASGSHNNAALFCTERVTGVGAAVNVRIPSAATRVQVLVGTGAAIPPTVEFTSAGTVIGAIDVVGTQTGRVFVPGQADAVTIPGATGPYTVVFDLET